MTGADLKSLEEDDEASKPNETEEGRSAVSRPPARLRKSHKLEHRLPSTASRFCCKVAALSGPTRRVSTKHWPGPTSAPIGSSAPQSAGSIPRSSPAIRERGAWPSCASSGSSSAALPSVSTATSAPCWQEAMPRAPSPNNERHHSYHARRARLLRAAHSECFVSAAGHTRGDELLRYDAAQGDARAPRRFRPHQL